MLSKGAIALLAFIITCLEDANSTVIASYDFNRAGSSVLFGYSLGGASILLNGQRMIGRAVSYGSNTID
jgi:hypothetical protein